MSNILKVKKVSDYSSYIGNADRHPLVSVIDYAALSPVRHSLNDYSVYGLFMHRNLSIDLTYGCGKYDYRNGTLICVAPGQIGGKEDNGERIDLDGYGLLFHPDLMHGTPLEHVIRKYTFFDYRVNEALHTTAEEWDTLVSLMRHIKTEIERPRDDFQDGIIVEYIILLLDYCMRFYNRQFLTRKFENNDMLMRFDALLRDYFESRHQLSGGIPSVQYCADKLCLSPNYFGDLVRKTTGDSAASYIRRFVVQQAKNELAAGTGVAQVAYDLGFEYPQHLTRMFKKQTGMTPSQYCAGIGKKR